MPTAEEQEVYKHVKKYLEKKPLFSIEEILGVLTQRLRNNEKLNRNRIEKIIKDFIKKNYIILGSKIVKENVLETELRKEINEFIEKNPGIHLTELINSLEIGSHQALWHLKFLKKFDLIKSMKMGNKKAFFPKDLKEEDCKACFYLRNDKVNKIIEALNDSDSIGPTKISEVSELHFNTVKNYLDVLLELGLITETEDEKNKEYRLNKKTYEEAVVLVKP